MKHDSLLCQRTSTLEMRQNKFVEQQRTWKPLTSC